MYHENWSPPWFQRELASPRIGSSEQLNYLGEWTEMGSIAHSGPIQGGSYHSLGRVTDCRKGAIWLSTASFNSLSQITNAVWPTCLSPLPLWLLYHDGLHPQSANQIKYPKNAIQKVYPSKGKITKTMSLRFRCESVHLWDKLRIYLYYPSVEVRPRHTSLPVL